MATEVLKKFDRGPFRRAALKSYEAQMSQPHPDGLIDRFVAHVLEEQGFDWVEQPRSIYEPAQLYTALERYATSWLEFEKLDTFTQKGFAAAHRIFSKPKEAEYFEMPSELELVGSLKLEKSSGLPLLTTKANSLAYSLDREKQVRAGIKAPNPCVAYKRTQKNNKTRLVWGYPLEMTIMEARFARPLIDHFRNHSNPMALGLSKLELGAEMFSNFENQPGTTVCLDFSKFDSTISATMIDRAFRILKTWFRPEDLKLYGWETIVKYFITTPIVMPDGHLYCGKNHGVPSGSYFTQLIDSVVNVAMMYSLKYACNMKFKSKSLKVLGDDVIVQVTSSVEIEKYSEYLKTFGLILHGPEKTVIGEQHFLGATWRKGKPHRDIGELCSNAVCPESFRDYGGDIYRGPRQVLRSYASNYLEGILMVPREPTAVPSWWMRIKDLPLDHTGDLNSRYMSGSDKFFFEENRNGFPFTRSRLVPPTLGVRILM